ncbi:MAG: alginate export family protein [Bacteroidota bacterium]
MKTTKIFFVTAILTLISHCSFSQFAISLELRPRGEFRKGYKMLPDENTVPATFISQRSRISFGFKTEKLNTKISFQDVRVWGDEAFKTDKAGLGIYEAWAEIAISDSFFLKTGKQEFVYDNERLLSKSNWTQLGAAHNAALLSYKKNGFQIDFAAAFNQSTENIFGTDYSDLNTSYKTLDFLWISKKINDNIKVSLLGIADGYQKEETENTTYLRGTFGGIAEAGKEKKYSVAVRGFYQTGRLQTGQEIAAYYGNADFSYTIKEKYTVIAGIEYISGEDALDTANTKSNIFCTLYGSGHKFNGNMDYYTNMSNDTKNAGLVNPYLNFIIKLSEKSKIRADFHYFFLQNNYLNLNNELVNKALGAEADLTFSYDISKDASVLTGFSVINPTQQMKIFSGGDGNYYGTWGFVMLTVKPTLFKSDKK